MPTGALIGFGEVAEKAHAPAWKKFSSASIVAAVDGSPVRRAAAAKAFPGLRLYATLKELLKKERDIDFVDIATPPHLHAEQCKAALAAGLHVLCEKPLVLSKKAFTALAEEARSRNLALFTTHNWKYAPLFQKLRNLLDKEAIGKVQHMEWHTLRSQPAAVAVKGKTNWRIDKKLSGGGILIDHGWHAFYLLTWLIGDSPQKISGSLKFPSDSPRGSSEREATCLIDFSQASAVVHLTWNAAKRSHWGVLRGEKGSIEILDDRLSLISGNTPPHTYVFSEALSQGSAHPEWFFDMLADFCEAIHHPRKRKQNLQESGHCIALIEDVYAQHA